LVVRQYLLNDRNRIEKTKMLYFYATPTNGAEIAAAARVLSANPQLRGMTPIEGNDLLQSINQAWSGWKEGRDVPSYCAFENLPVSVAGVVTTRSSATALCNRPPDPLDYNHIEIVKPTGYGDPRYQCFANALRTEVPRKQ